MIGFLPVALAAKLGAVLAGGAVVGSLAVASITAPPAAPTPGTSGDRDRDQVQTGAPDGDQARTQARLHFVSTAIDASPVSDRDRDRDRDRDCDQACDPTGGDPVGAQTQAREQTKAGGQTQAREQTQARDQTRAGDQTKDREQTKAREQASPTCPEPVQTKKQAGPGPAPAPNPDPAPDPDPGRGGRGS